MRICIIGPGLISIPPVGWGAVERVIYGYAKALEGLGWTVEIINTSEQEDIISRVNCFNPDVVHCHYDQYAHLMKRVKCRAKIITPHYGYAGQVWASPEYYEDVHKEIAAQDDLFIFALSSEICDAYKSSGVRDARIYQLPNGTDSNSFRVTDSPLLGARTLCLGKIEPRKRQGLLQLTNAPIDFVGDVGDCSSGGFPFDVTSEQYLGTWTREKVIQSLTEYGNLILISDGEAHPLVCIEALSAGLGLVISRPASANLDIEQEFITLIPDERLNDLQYIEKSIERNRERSLKLRENIVAYSRIFDWSKLIYKYHDAIMEIISVSGGGLVAQEKKRLLNKKRLAIVTIATGPYYDKFFKDFSGSVKSLWGADLDCEIFCFTDRCLDSNMPGVTHIAAKRLGWPFDSLMRFFYLNSIREVVKGFDNVVFMDSDMIVTGRFDPELLDNDFFAVEHPGYLDKGWAPFEIDVKSSIHSARTRNSVYVQGCFFGGKAAPFCYMVSKLNSLIWSDLARYKVPVWHDESYLNWFASTFPVVRVSRAYAAPEGWDIGVAPKVVHRSKDASAMRGLNSCSPSSIFEVVMSGDQASRWEFYRDLGLEAHEKNQRLTDVIAQMSLEMACFNGLVHIFGRYLKAKLRSIPVLRWIRYQLSR